MNGLLHDLKYAARVLTKSPRFSLIVVLTLAIGIGVNVSNFSIVNSFLLRPQPYAEADQLVHVWHSDRKWDFTNGRFSLPTIQEFQRACEGCQDMAFYNYFGANLAGGETQPENLTLSRMSQNMLPMLGVQPMIGRNFGPDDVTEGRSMLLSHGLWQRRFGGSEDAVGETILLNDEPYTVIGVMPEAFSFPYGGVKAWVVVQPHLDQWDHDYRNFMPVVRLKPSVTRAQLTAQLDNVFQAVLSEHYPEDEGEPYVTVEPLREALLFLDDTIHLMLGLLTVATLLVLLIICTNIANLFLLRATSRQREVAVRAALGADRWSLVRQLLAEGLVLAIVGGALGALLAYWLLGLAAPVIPEDLYRVGEIGIDGWALGFSLLISILTVFVFALPPALQTLKTDLNLALKEGSSGSGVGLRARRSQNILVIAQTALAVILLVSTALAVRSFTNMDGVDPGFDSKNVLTMGMTLPSANFPETTQVRDFQRQTLERLSALPGIESAAFTAPLPMNFESWGFGFKVDGTDLADETQRGIRQYVSPGYFGTMGVRVLRGREFGDQDDLEASPVVIVNQTLAERFWPGQDPVGKRLRYDRDDEEVVASIVGVVEDTKRVFLSDEAGAMVFLSQTQNPSRSPWLVIKTAGDPLPMTASVRDQIWSLRPNLPLREIRSMDQVVAASLAPWSWSAILLGGFSVFALILASVGIYGVVAYAASQRTTEIGIRMAMGAEPRDILRFVMQKALVLTAVGVALGGLGSIALTRAMSSFLYGIGTTDPTAYGTVLVALGLATVLAALGPALRAARTDPSIVLRYE